MTLKSILPALLILALPFGSRAQQTPEQKAKAILDEVSQKAKAFKTVKADFEMTIEGADKSKTTQKGDIILKDKKYKITMKQKGKDKDGKPKDFNEEYITDTKSQWNYSEKNKEVTIDCAKATTKDGFAISDIFTIHEKGYDSKFEKEEKRGAKTVQVITLTPQKTDGKKVSKVTLEIDKAKKQVSSVTLHKTDGSKQTINIKSMKTNEEVPDSTFGFDVKAHPGVKVVDLREDC